VVGLWGTFDLDNYGDLLFPKIARRELLRRIPEARLRLFSPLGYQHPVGFEGIEPAEPLGSYTDRWATRMAAELDCVVIGGGDLLHTRNEAYSRCYGLSPDAMRRLGPSRFFIQGLGPERDAHCPVVWNAVGVPFDFGKEEVPELKRALDGRQYVAVRDEISQQRLLDAGVEAEIKVVPDTAFLLPRIYPVKDLMERLEYLREMVWFPREGPTIVVQGSVHLLPMVRVVAHWIRILAQERSASVVIVETGPCAGDGEFADELASILPVRLFRLPSNIGLEDVAASIAGGDVFMGTSLHGNITAFVYGRPHVVLDLGDLSKMEGLARLAGVEASLARRPEEIPDALVESERTVHERWDRLTLLQRRIDEHFDRIAEIAVSAVTGSGRRRQRRRAGDTLDYLDVRLELMEARKKRSEHERIRTLESLRELRADRDQVRADRERVRAEREGLQAEIADRERQIADLTAWNEQLRDTLGHRVRLRLVRVLDRLAPWGTRRRSLILVPIRMLKVLLTEGVGAFLRRFVRVHEWAPALFRRAYPNPDRLTASQKYTLWLELCVLSPKRMRAAKRHARRLRYRPTVSIVMPVHNAQPDWLHAAFLSVLGQAYERWELSVVDDASTDLGTSEVLRQYEGIDARIKIRYLHRNRGIAGASNEGLAMATGEFVGFLDHDDELKKNALYEVVKQLNEQPDLDFIYSDEDKKEPDGQLSDPFFKPDWSPDLLMSVNYVTHFAVCRRSVIERVGGFREGFEGSQDYDLILRVSEVTDRMGHVSLPLYTWRKVPGSAAAAVQAKAYALGAAKRALAEAARRRGYEGLVEDGLVEGRYRLRYMIRGRPTVLIIIPTRDKVEMLRRCIESVRTRTTYEPYEIMIVDNASQDPETLEYLSSLEGRVLPYPHPFNYARMMNVAVSKGGDADLVLFLNNDTEVISGEWLEAMVEHAQRPEVAAVGARLLYPDGTPQHEGIIVGFGGGSAGNVNFGGYDGMGDTIRNCSAVTGACMLFRREVYEEMGGLEERLGVAFNDVDFCLRAREKGYQIVYTPHAVLYHHESATRGTLHPDEDERFFRARWGDPGDYRDPYYNPNLDPLASFQLRKDIGNCR
jgi:GT2 family glycosyltransferase/polysaccharide pyruvyl transferase WcaK-like protein